MTAMAAPQTYGSTVRPVGRTGTPRYRIRQRQRIAVIGHRSPAMATVRGRGRLSSGHDARGTRGKRPSGGCRRVATAGLVVLSAGGGSDLLSTSSSGSDTTTRPPGPAPRRPPSPSTARSPSPSRSSPAPMPTFGGAPIKSASGWSPTILVAPIPTSLVGKVTFYTDGVHTLLGPAGLDLRPGGAGRLRTGLPGVDDHPPPSPGRPARRCPPPRTRPVGGHRRPGRDHAGPLPPERSRSPDLGRTDPGAEGVFATYATTGTDAGVDLVCPFFTIPSWQVAVGRVLDEQAGRGTHQRPHPGRHRGGRPRRRGRATSPPPAARRPYRGRALPPGPFRHLVRRPERGGRVVRVVDPSLCPTVLSDFEVREFPVPPGRRPPPGSTSPMGTGGTSRPTATDAGNGTSGAVPVTLRGLG